MTILVDQTQEGYLIFRLTTGSASQKETALERICDLLEDNFIPTRLSELTGAISNLFFDESERVKRWAFNAAAQLGTRMTPRLKQLQLALPLCQENETLLCSACAALFSVMNDDQLAGEFLNNAGIEPTEAIIVAGSRYSNACKRALEEKKIIIDNAGPVALQNAAVLIGLGKVPDNVFSERHPYKEVIGRLALHDDAIVAQYAVWAICENPMLSIHDLALDVRDFDKYPPNVKKWILRLTASDRESASELRGLLEKVANDSNVQMREYVAVGLSETHYNGVENLVLPWFFQEKDDETKLALLDHMTYNSDISMLYRDVVKEEYKKLHPGSPLRTRLEIAASGCQIYSDFKLIEAQERMTLLLPLLPFYPSENRMTVNANNSTIITINGNENLIGAVASGSGLSQSDVQLLNGLKDHELKEVLFAIINAIKESDDKLTKNIRGEVLNVAKNPCKMALTRLLETVKAASHLAEFGVILGKLGFLIAGMDM